MGDVWRPIYYSRIWRPRSPSVERAESSVSRKRPRSSAPPCRVPLRYYSEDDDDDENNDVFDDGRHGRDDDDDREEDEEQIRAEDERDDDDDGEEDEEQIRAEDERGDESSGGSDAEDVVAGVAEEQPLAEEEFSDDDRPISVVSRARTLVRRGSTSTAPSPTTPSSSSSDSSSVIGNVTVENSSAFDCTICYHALKSPIFQCTVGHVVCSPCHDKLRHATTCHVCRDPIPGGYSRCIAMEQVVDSIRFPCPHAAHGCAERLAYHDHDDHARTCVHKPCHCPADGCGFAGSVQTTLLEHFAAVHGWPCSAGSTIESCGFDISLRKGFNVVTVMDEQQYTLVLKNVEQAAPVSNTITAFCIHPSYTGIVKLGLSYYQRWRWDSTLPSKYLQSSQLDVLCTDLSNGMPGPSSCIPFSVPRWSAAPGGDDIDDISVTVNYIRRDMLW